MSDKRTLQLKGASVTLTEGTSKNGNPYTLLNIHVAGETVTMFPDADKLTILKLLAKLQK